MGIHIKVFSYGGSGCTALRHGLGIAHHDDFKHRRSPPTLPRGCKVGYIVGNPMNAVLSFFGRKTAKWDFPLLHGRNLGVDIDPKMDLHRFIDQGRDCFGLEEHFDNWCNKSLRSYPILLIRYESMCNHTDEIGRWFGRSCSIEHRPRKSNWKTQQQWISDGLRAVYGRLWDKIISFDEICQI
jgi:hypothetical protein